MSPAWAPSKLLLLRISRGRLSLLSRTFVDAVQMLCQKRAAACEHGFYAGYTYEAAKAIDGRPETMWHSKFNPKAPLPQSITLNLGGTYSVRGVAVQPRYEKPSNGILIIRRGKIRASLLNAVYGRSPRFDPNKTSVDSTLLAVRPLS